MSHHYTFSLKNYIYDFFEKIEMCNISQGFSLESGKHAAVG